MSSAPASKWRTTRTARRANKPARSERSPSGVGPPERELTAYLFDLADSSAPAFTHIDYSTDRAGIAHTVSWGELATRVRSTAAHVAKLTDPSARVAVLAGQDLGYVIGFLGALHAGRVAVPLFAPAAHTKTSRLINVLADCTPEMWLTSRTHATHVHALCDGGSVPRPKQILSVDDLDTSVGEGFVPGTPTLDSAAYLQYTSGSTRTPAGAVISHRALVMNAWQACTAFELRSDWTCAGWIPFFHDMGLVQLLCLPVLTGSRSVFMAPFDFIAKPARWLHQLSNVPGAFTAAPNFAYDYAARKVGERERAALDLSEVRVMINGSEPVKPETIDRFNEAFRPCGLPANAQRPSYGLAEATVFVSGTRDSGARVTSFDRAALTGNRAVALAPDDPRAVRLVAAGTPQGQHVRIVDPDSHTALGDGRIGEIWVHGPNVADGYWRQPRRDAETFGASLLDPLDDVPTTGWLRTGDLGLYHDGLLYVTGRIKDLIIVDGMNHYPQDIEATVSNAHPSIRREHVAAFSVPAAGGFESAAIVAELAEGLDPEAPEHDEIVRSVRRAVADEHDIGLNGVVLTAAGSLPRTSSGKLSRAATRSEFWSTE